MSASDCGMDVLYEGIRLTPEQIVKSSVEEDVHIIGLSILSGSHVQLVGEIMNEMKKGQIDILVSTVVIIINKLQNFLRRKV